MILVLLLTWTFAGLVFGKQLDFSAGAAYVIPFLAAAEKLTWRKLGWWKWVAALCLVAELVRGIPAWPDRSIDFMWSLAVYAITAIVVAYYSEREAKADAPK